MKLKIAILSVLLLPIVACDVAKTAKETKGIAEESGKRLARVERNGTLLEMKRDLFDERNTRTLDPVPFNMLLPGRRLAQNLTADEWVEYASLLISEIKEDQTPGGRSPGEFDHYKRVREAALGIISGFLPQATFDQILVNHVYGSSAYKSGALAIVVFRGLFISDVLLRNAILEKKINSSGQVAVAIERATALDQIARLPFIGHIKVELDTFSDPSLNHVLAFEPQTAAEIWVELARKAKRYNPETVANYQTDKASAQRSVAQEKSAMTAHMSRIYKAMRDWNVAE